MKNLKKLTALIMIGVMLFSTATPAMAAGVTQPMSNDFDSGEIMTLPFVFDDVFLPVSAEWCDFVANETPATFSNVSYQLADGVVEIDSTANTAARNAIRNIATAEMRKNGVTEQIISPNRIVAEGAYISTDVLTQAMGNDIKNGTVVLIGGQEPHSRFWALPPFPPASLSPIQPFPRWPRR